ncbi:MAG: electron transport complex subunit RsxA [Deltaproteobacteria bacterium]|nr:electron transport complex subunit RsxA [Deltaproteobacteria bacterium]
MTDYLLLMVSAILVNNILLTRFLGNCPFIGVSRRMETATGMGMAIIFVMTLAGSITWLVQKHILEQYGLEYLQTIFFILIIAALVQIVETVIRKTAPPLYRSLGIFLPLITTNCAVLGVAILNVKLELTFAKAILFSFSSALGFTMALVLFAGIRERFELAKIPKPFQGTAIALVTAGFMALAFSGFVGMVD